MDKEEIRNAEIEYCRGNIDYYIDNYVYFEDKDNKTDIVQPFRRWKEQREATTSIMKHRLNIILKARQLGFSWLACAIASYYILFPGKTIICLSRSEEEAKELIRRICFILTWAPELFSEKKTAQIGWSGISFENTLLSIYAHYKNGVDSRIMAMASGPGAGRSFTADLIIIDEWAFQQFAREIWTAAFPTINSPNGGKVIGLSTIERGSLFEELFTDPDNGFNKIFIPWYADPKRDSEWYDRTKRALGSLITQEYPATIEEALMVPGGAYFPNVRKDTHESDEMLKGPLKRYCHFDYGLDMLAARWTVVDALGNSQTYREYDSPNLTISQAAQVLLSISSEEQIDAWLAPPDLWNRRQETGKSVADIFAENGINLIKVSNDLLNGCLLLTELLKIDDETGKCKHTFLKDTCPNTIKCLQKIQKDKVKPSVYSKTPHELTHSVDAMRYFAVWWVTPPSEEPKKKKKWTEDLIEDWKHANKEMRAYMVKKLGEPIL